MLNKCTLVKKLIYDAQYKDVLKNAYVTLKRNIGKRNMGDGISSNTSPIVSIREIILKYNTKLSPNAPKSLTKSTLHRYVHQTNICVSPLKMGPPTKVPLCYEKIFALHIRMIQNSIGNFLNLIIIIITSLYLYFFCFSFLYFSFILLLYNLCCYM